MDASLETLVVAGYVFATSLSIPRPGPPGLVSDHELIALAVAQAITGLCSDRQFPLFADKGLWGKELDASMELINVQLITPDRHQLGKRPPAEIAKARIRLVIESVFSNLKRQMRLEQHLAKTITGLVQRIAQRLLALTLGMFLNTLLGRPPRALAAYDGR